MTDERFSMRETYVFRDGKVIPKSEAKPIVVAPHIWSDLPDYKSPLGTGVISGRAARREDLKRHNCVEVDPGHWKPDPEHHAKKAQYKPWR
jgi:hypothetical protein